MEQPRISSTPTGAQPAGGPSKARSSGPDAHKTGLDNGANTPSAGGFLALLAALENAGSDPSTDSSLLQSQAQTDAGAPSALHDASALAAWQGLLLAGAQVQPEGSGSSTSHSVTTQGGFAKGGALLPGVDGRPQGLVAETALLDTAADLQPASPGFPGPGLRPSGRWQGAGPQQQRADAPLGALGSAGRTAVLADGMSSPLRPGDAALVPGLQQGPAPTRGDADATSAARASLAEGFEAASETVAATAGGDNDTMVMPMAGAGTAAVGSAAAGGNSSTGSGAESMVEAFSREAAPMDGASAHADPAAAMAAEEQIAEQVAYWVHQKTQTAELTVHRDGEPVEVSVSLSGNEAHVSFGSDQAQTRDMLDRSMAQLGELLQREGLVLSGMSVGTSAGQGRGNAEQQQRQREGARQATVNATALAGTAAAASLRGGAAADRTVDVFV